MSTGENGRQTRVGHTCPSAIHLASVELSGEVILAMGKAIGSEYANLVVGALKSRVYDVSMSASYVQANTTGERGGEGAVSHGATALICRAQISNVLGEFVAIGAGDLCQYTQALSLSCERVILFDLLMYVKALSA